MAVVMIDKCGQRSFEMPSTEREQPVETLGPGRSDEPFRNPIGFRRLNWRANDSRPLCLEHRIEAVRKLAVVIANQKAHRRVALGERPRDLSGVLRHPLAVGMRGAAGEMYAAAPDFDEEEHIQPLEPNGIDAEKVYGDQTVGLSTEELPPRWTASRAHRTELVLAQDLPDAGRRGSVIGVTKTTTT